MQIMNPGDIPLLSMLKGRLEYLSNRQKVIAENVANSDTPGYLARDLKPYDFKSHMQAATLQGSSSVGGPTQGMAPSGAMAMTQQGHMQIPTGKTNGFKPKSTPDSEVKIDGNGVVLEDQMVKLTDARMQYDAAISFYQQSVGMLKTAIRRPGSGT